MKQKESANMDKKNVIYIIGVHGIGEQRKNETVLPIINGFARIRQCQQEGEGGKTKQEKHPYRPLTQGMLTSQQASTPWIEFSGIPCEPDRECPLAFIGRKLEDDDPSCGSNFRFVDLHWADIMQNHFDKAGQPVETWTQSLVDRLKLRGLEKHENYFWIPELLESMRRGILPVKKLLSLKQRLLTGTNDQLTDTIFNRFLGDAQLYGEYTVTRSQASFRFHETLANVHAAHLEEQNKNPEVGAPRYVVVAHSLGSIMSFDALLYAHAKKNTNTRGLSVLDLNEVMLPGYQSITNPKANLPRMDWVEYVDTFITLGSPIDKYLTLWWMNYEHLIEDDWLDDELVSQRDVKKIQHYNYCDEQDPVGHELDTAYSPTTKAVHAVFDKKEDAVFMRYGTAGVAHIKYWDDLPLLRRIMNKAIDRKDDEPTKASSCEVDWFSQSAYLKTLVWSYFAIPSIGLVLTLILFFWGMYGISNDPINLLAASVGTLGGIAVFGISLSSMGLMIRWRQLARCARTRRQENYTEKDKKARKRMERMIRKVIYFAPLFWIVVSILTWKYLPPMQEMVTNAIYFALFGAILISSLNLYWFIAMKIRLNKVKWLPAFFKKLESEETAKFIPDYSLDYRAYIESDPTRPGKSKKKKSV
jgi:hypothetical protein